MAELVRILEDIDVGVFAALALVSLLTWRKQRNAAAMWMALTFGTLAAVAIVGRLVPDQPTSEILQWVERLVLTVVALFPYFLYRFMASFGKRRPLWDRIVIAMTVVVAVWPLFLPSLPGENEPRPRSFSLFIVAFLLQWTTLSLIVAIRLWRAGRGQTTVVRRRMRLLSLGSVGLSIAVILASAAPAGGSVAIDLVVQVLAMSSAALFFIGYSPPAFLRNSWRRPEEEEMQEAIVGLMGATSLDEVTEVILPHVARIVGARGAALLTKDGGVIGSYTQDPAWQAEFERLLQHGPVEAEDRASQLEKLDFPFGDLVVWVGPYAPFFGREEFDLLTTLGVLGNLALERSNLFEKERSAREALQKSNSDLVQREVQLAQAQDVAHLGSWAWDVPNDIVTWSDELYRIFGLMPQEFGASYKAFMEYVHPDDREMLDTTVRTALDTKAPYEIEHRILHPSGELRVLHSSGKVIVDETGAPIRMIGTGQDVTERIAQQKKQEEYERRISEARIRQQQALEINDNVVQGLTVAKYAHELGRAEQTQDAIDGTLAAARRIITNLLEQRQEGTLGPGDLVREQAATVSGPEESSGA